MFNTTISDSTYGSKTTFERIVDRISGEIMLGGLCVVCLSPLVTLFI